MEKKAIGLFGGTFDPIHQGHLHIAEKLIAELPLDHIQFIPCGHPPHRSAPLADPIDRFNMIQQAIAAKPNLKVNDIEIKQSQPAYTLQTVKAMRHVSPNQSLCFILATDAFAHFDQWYRPHDILHYCHLIVVNRPGFVLPKTKWFVELLETHQIQNPHALTDTLAGHIYFQEIPFLDISATHIRNQLKKGNLPKGELPPAVLDYILAHKLYQE